MRAARRLVITWIATLAVLMASLAPTLSIAMGMPGAGPWTLICSSANDGPVAFDDGTTGERRLPGMAHLLDHCPYCSLHADAWPMPPSPPVLPQPMLLGEPDPPAFLHADETLSVWSSAQPRAPPIGI
jgi:hypothetical protein